MSSPLTPALWRATLVFLATAAVGAAQLAEFRDRHFDAATGQVLSLVDLDADGDLDLVALPQEQRPLLLHENLGQLRFRDLGATALPPVTFPSSLVLLDISGDGRPDILTPGSVLRAFVRVGGLYREESWRLPTGLGPVYRVHFGDVDGDGDVDLLALTAQLRVLRNDGTGNFTLDPLPGPDTPWGGSVAVDLDGDRAIDLVRFLPGGLLVLANDGRGVFHAMPAIPATEPTAGVAVDVDRDGDLDLVVQVGGAGQNQLALFGNDGAGALRLVPGAIPAPRSGFLHDVRALDVDGDRDDDLAIAGAMFATEILINQGGTFVRPAAARLPAWPEVGSFAAGDVDGDGAPDLVLRPDGVPDPVLGLNERGRFSPVNPPDVLPGVQATGDLDGDGDPDLVAFHFSERGYPPLASTVYVARNDGAGRSSVLSRLDLPEPPFEAMTGDADADGDIDILVLAGVSRTSTNNLYTLANDGRGQLSVARVQQVYDGRRGQRAAHDLDRDGDVDIAWADGFNAIVLENRRAAGFVALPLPGVQLPAHSVSAFDLEGDGLPELLLTDVTGLRLYANGGGLNFVDRSTLIVGPLAGAKQAAVAPSRNGFYPLVLWSLSYNPQLIAVHGFDGTRFVPGGQLPIDGVSGGAWLRAARLTDGPYPQAIVQVFRANVWQTLAYDLIGSTPYEVTQTALGSFSRGVLRVLGDRDGDGDGDAMWESQDGAQTRLLRGRAMQVHAPYGAHRGFEYRLDLAVSGSSAGFLLGVVPARIPTPFGVLRLDPAAAVGLGYARSLQFTLPDDGALLGLPLLTQAFQLASGRLQLSNLESRRIH